MAKILILIGAHISTAPRPQKEADLLTQLGHDVVVMGVWFNKDLIERDLKLIKEKKWAFKPVLDFQPAKRFSNFKTRVKHRLAREVFKIFRIVSSPLFGYGTQDMLRAALRIKADITIVHSEGGLWVGKKLLQKGFRVGVDFEDWFSEDLLPTARAARPIGELKKLEQLLAKKCSYSLTTSCALSEALAKSYNSLKPTVIYNTFPWSERTGMDNLILDRKDRTLPSIHWFSHTIGPGRGLEILFKALPLLTIPFEIHLRGAYPDHCRKILDPLIPSKWKDRVFIHPTVPGHKLLSRIAEHDIGLALETNMITSRNLTVTNKLFQYMLAGLAVIATNTAGQIEIMSKWSSPQQIVECNNPVALAKAIETLLKDRNNLISAKEASLRAAKDTFCWEDQIGKIENSINLALKSHLGE